MSGRVAKGRGRLGTVGRPRPAGQVGLLEQDFQQQVLDIAKRYGWKAFHHPDSRRATGRGLPDLILLKAPRIVYVELKKGDGRLSDDQREVLGILDACGAEVTVWRPSDLALAVRVLGPRGERATLNL